MGLEEQVLCVPRSNLWPHGEVSGISSDLRWIRPAIATAATFVSREIAEEDLSMQQIIPYCVILTADGRNVFTTIRRGASTEQRLHGKRAIGIGGHINPADDCGGSDGWEIVRHGLIREWSEEVCCSKPVHADLIGVLNDDSAPVSMVHLGLVYRILVDDSYEIAVRETEKLEGTFLPREQVQAHTATESWARLALVGIDHASLPEYGVEIAASPYDTPLSRIAD